MIVGVPKEIKTAENRVALVPAGAESLANDGHRRSKISDIGAAVQFKRVLVARTQYFASQPRDDGRRVKT